MKQVLMFISCLLLFQAISNAKEIAITFDDAPRYARGYFDGPTRAERLIESLKKASVQQVAFFSISKGLSEEGKSRIEKYVEAGHLIANHTHSHFNFNETSLSEYRADFLLADKALSSFKNYMKWFRFPYLREGNDLEKRDGMRTVLKENHYFNAYITVNNYDWYIEDIFQKKLKEGIKLDFDKIKKFYVNVLRENVEFYDDMAIKLLGRSPKHVLLLHETDINALFISDLISELQSRGWKVISPLEAYKDEIADYKAIEIRNNNPGRIGEIARDRGQASGLWPESANEKYLDERFQKEVIDNAKN